MCATEFQIFFFVRLKKLSTIRNENQFFSNFILTHQQLQQTKYRLLDSWMTLISKLVIRCFSERDTSDERSPSNISLLNQFFKTSLLTTHCWLCRVKSYITRAKSLISVGKFSPTHSHIDCPVVAPGILCSLPPVGCISVIPVQTLVFLVNDRAPSFFEKKYANSTLLAKKT